jgi:serine/threonine protein kinase
MRYIHAKGYIHRDLKPDNILISSEGKALISDFGTVCRESSDETPTPDTGTVNYAAPERFQEEIPCTNSVDVFSFGSIIYEILTEKPVFPSSLPPFHVMKLLFEGQMPVVPDSCGYLQQLIRRCWSRTPESRPSFYSILHEFANQGFAVVPGSNPRQVRQYVEAVCKWERINGVSL